MAGHVWENIYDLSEAQLESLDQAETLMEGMDLTAAETILLEMLEAAPECVPVLSNLGHLYGKYLSEFENAVKYYEQVLEIEPDNAWARDARRRYARYVDRD
jgi:tetratricopeptide (TPR) repeat protein